MCMYIPNTGQDKKEEKEVADCNLVFLGIFSSHADGYKANAQHVIVCSVIFKNFHFLGLASLAYLRVLIDTLMH